MTKKHAHSPETPAKPAAEEKPVPPAEPVEEPTPAPPVEPTVEPEVEPPEPLQHQLLRLQADFDNFRKRIARERKDWIAAANEDLVTELLPVLDHFELGLADGAKNGVPPAMLEGFQLIYNQLMGVLSKAGVEPIDAVGKLFDPHWHEAMMHQPSDTVPAEHVVAQTRRGYKMGDKLLRAAQVLVSSGPAA